MQCMKSKKWYSMKKNGKKNWKKNVEKNGNILYKERKNSNSM